jgi:hypothetical protein
MAGTDNYITKRNLVLLILIFNLNSLLPQIPGDFPLVTDDDLPGARFSRPRIFNGTSLFGYIDGGAELYLEYGFSMLAVTEIDYMGGKYKTEIYRMNGPEEAFGIFSVSKFRCAGMPPVSDFTCQTKYQLQICKGPYYISVINRTGTGNDSIASLNIGEAIARKIKDEQIDLSFWMPGLSIGEIKQNCILAKGKLGIVNGAPDLEDFFSGTRNFTTVIVKGSKRLIAIRFDSGESLEKFFVLHNWKIDTPQPGVRLKRTGDVLLNIEMEN